jgi:hypothetical protein
MKPLKEDQQPIHICRTVLLSWRQTLNPLHEEEGGLDASNNRGLTERSGEVFSLDIPLYPLERSSRGSAGRPSATMSMTTTPAFSPVWT